MQVPARLSTLFPRGGGPAEALTHQLGVRRQGSTQGVVDGVLGDPESPPGEG